MKAKSDEFWGEKVSGFGSSEKTNAPSRAGNLKINLQRYHQKEYVIDQAHDNTKRTEKSQASTRIELHFSMRKQKPRLLS